MNNIFKASSNVTDEFMEYVKVNMKAITLSYVVVLRKVFERYRHSERCIPLRTPKVALISDWN